MQVDELFLKGPKHILEGAKKQTFESMNKCVRL